jgi:uncharacterized protein (TIGR02598 family)
MKRIRSIIAPGFSLVETVIALGIMGLAITALLGLIPHGIEMSRKAGQASAMARIVDTISTRLANMPFSALTPGATQRLVFDDQGVQLEAGKSEDAVYVVEVQLAATTQLPGAVIAQKGLATAIVNIAATSNIAFNFSNARPNRYTTLPVNIGPFIP